jgi:hypothetical protein
MIYCKRTDYSDISIPGWPLKRPFARERLTGTQMFGITSAYRFFERFGPITPRVEADIADPGAALNCILSLYHLHEWVWARWLKQRPNVQATLGIRKDIESFKAWLDEKCPHFTLVQELANGTKHCRPVYSTKHVKGYGRGPYGIGPFWSPYLLIDLGQKNTSAEHYLVASAVLKATLDFLDRLFRYPWDRR